MSWLFTWSGQSIGSLASASVQFSRSVVSDSLRPHESQHARPPCSSPTPGVHPNSCPWSQWCHPAISSSLVPFSSCPQSLPASESFPMSQLFAWCGQSIGVSALASVLPMNIQGQFPLGLIGLISLLFKQLWRVFSSTTVQKHRFFSAQVSLWSNSQLYWEYISYTSMKEEYRVHIYNWILFSHEKKVNCAICDKMDETWGHAKWN